jgi:flagellar assembly protein FliH
MRERSRAPRILGGVEHAGRPFVGESSASSGNPAETAAARGREEGRAEGYLKAAAEVEEERRKLRAEIAASLLRIAELEERLTRRHESLLLEIALEAGSKIARARIEAHDPVAVRAVRDAIDALPPTATARARLHPGDLEVVARELSAEIGRGKIELKADDTLTPGGCVVESAVGTIDATVETAQEAVRAAALGAMASP